MKINLKEINWNRILKSVLCIALGTGAGLIVYGIFLYFNIAIFGWNLGLIFAPLTAGYVETIFSRKLLGKDIGAISALILFLDTTFYSFILKNPTLGMNIITAGSIIVILQSAFPTVINYILLVVIGSVVSNFKWTLTHVGRKIKNGIKHNVRWETTNEDLPPEVIPYFDEDKSNQKLNNLNFFFITSTDMKHENPHEIIGIFQSEVIVEINNTISVKSEAIEKERLVTIKNGKDECLMNLADKIKKQGGNGILDLNIQYGLIGMGRDNIHITATGMGIHLNNTKNIMSPTSHGQK